MISKFLGRYSLLIIICSTGLLFLAACNQLGRSQRVALCGQAAQLRIGYVGSKEGREAADQVPLSANEIVKLRDLLTVASHCEVILEPVASPERARDRLENGAWDAAFLPPGLTAVALERSKDPGFSLVRPLGLRQSSQSMLLVRSDSPFHSLSELRKARLGLLPRGSLTGYYLPLYNMHGLRFSSVHYALSYNELITGLRNGTLDVIAWDGDLADPGSEVRPIFRDVNKIPLGAFVMSGDLISADHQPFLKTLDENSSQLPPKLDYVAGTLPQPQALYRLRNIINSVEKWDVPLEGQPYSVFGQRLPDLGHGER